MTNLYYLFVYFKLLNDSISIVLSKFGFKKSYIFKFKFSNNIVILSKLIVDKYCNILIDKLKFQSYNLENVDLVHYIHIEEVFHV